MINKKIYILDYEGFKEQLLPIILRKPKWLALLQALIIPFKALYEYFFGFKEDSIYRAQHYGSVGLLEKALNDAFDDVERRIFINNAALNDTQHYYDEGAGDPLYFYDEGEGDPQWFFDPIVFNVYESDFTVFIPMALRPDDEDAEERLLTRVRALIDYYKIYGPKYTIVWLS
ncbi:MAG: hypothetical protein CL528_11270 [Aequorivita sp.]|nr:hypothetical protein [Aequorivita sp.]MBP42346.1 hypothetical protein [Aequorivita sp.]